VSKVAPVLCLLAIVAAQVPMIACASDCQETLVSAAGDHSCHAPAEEARRHGCHFHGHGALDQRDHHEEPVEEDHPEAVHELVQISVLSAGYRLVLPEHTYTSAPLDLATEAAGLPTIHDALEAAHRAEPDPVPVPLPASVRLLL